MTAVRGLIEDLVERRLWPFALALVVALFAVPVALHKSAPSAAPATSATVAPAAPQPAGPAVTAVATLQTSTPRGARKDPFVQKHVPKAVTLAPAGSTAPTAGAPGAGSTGSAPTGSTAPATSTPTTSPTTSKPKVYVTYSAKVRFSRAGTTGHVRSVPRLSPLPNASNPVVIYLGVLTDGKTAAFLVTSDATVQGDGDCLPNARQCTTLYIKKGETSFFDVTDDAGGVTQYQLDLVKLVKTTTTSVHKARAARARVSKSGRRLLRHDDALRGTMKALPLQYSKRAGLLREPASPLGWLKLMAADSAAKAAGDPSAPVVAAAATPQPVVTPTAP